MDKRDLKKRTKLFALMILDLAEQLPHKFVSEVIARQLVRCGTSVGANYRAACRAKSKADFIAKMGIVEEEADEVMYWLELLKAKNLMSKDALRVSHQEADQLVAIAVSSIKTARG